MNIHLNKITLYSSFRQLLGVSGGKKHWVKFRKWTKLKLLIIIGRNWNKINKFWHKKSLNLKSIMKHSKILSPLWFIRKKNFVNQYKQIWTTFTGFDDTCKISLCYSFSNKNTLYNIFNSRIFIINFNIILI